MAARRKRSATARRHGRSANLCRPIQRDGTTRGPPDHRNLRIARDGHGRRPVASSSPVRTRAVTQHPNIAPWESPAGDDLGDRATPLLGTQLRAALTTSYGSRDYRERKRAVLIPGRRTDDASARRGDRRRGVITPAPAWAATGKTSRPLPRCSQTNRSDAEQAFRP